MWGSLFASTNSPSRWFLASPFLRLAHQLIAIDSRRLARPDCRSFRRGRWIPATRIHGGTAVAKKPAPAKDALDRRRHATVYTPTDLQPRAAQDLAGAMNGILANLFALHLKSKNFHWHMSGPHFRDYHLLLDEEADQLYAMTDTIAERVRKVGGTTLRSIGHIAGIQRIKDNDAEYVETLDMLAELREDNKALTVRLREAHEVCDEHRDVASASLVENGIDESERRTWFLFEAGRRGDPTGH